MRRYSIDVMLASTEDVALLAPQVTVRDADAYFCLGVDAVCRAWWQSCLMHGDVLPKEGVGYHITTLSGTPGGSVWVSVGVLLPADGPCVPPRFLSLGVFRRHGPASALRLLLESWRQGLPGVVGEARRPSAPPALLTRREVAVLAQCASGARLRVIADSLNISVKTVSAHKLSAMRKLHLRRVHDLSAWLRQGGLAPYYLKE